MELNVTNENFAELKNSDLPLVVDFWATWCGPCRMIAPIVEELAKEYEGRVIIGKCDVDDNVELTTRFGIRSVPSVFFLKNGQIVDKSVGAAPKQTFVEKIEALLNA